MTDENKVEHQELGARAFVDELSAEAASARQPKKKTCVHLRGGYDAAKSGPVVSPSEKS
jgi:hypothetical protein